MPFNNYNTELLIICGDNAGMLQHIAGNDEVALAEDIAKLLMDFQYAFQSKSERNVAVTAFLNNKKNPNNNFNFAQLAAFAEATKTDSVEIATAFFSNSASEGNNLKNLFVTLDMVNEEHQNYHAMVRGFLSSSLEEISFDNLRQINAYLERRRLNSHGAKTLFSGFLANETNKFNRLNFAQLFDALDEFQPKSRGTENPNWLKHEGETLCSFLANKSNPFNHLRLDELKLLFEKRDINITANPELASEALAAYLSNENNEHNRLTVDELKALVETYNIEEMQEIFIAYFGNKNNPKSFEEFQDLVKSHAEQIDDFEDALKEIFRSCLAVQKTDDALVAHLCSFIKEFDLIYNFEKIEELFETLNEEDSFELSNGVLLQVAQNLYPTNEVLRLQFFTEFFNYENYADEENIELTKQILASLSNDAALEFLQFLGEEHDVEFDDKALLLLVKGRAHSRYASLTADFKGKKLSGIFNKEFVATLNEELGKDFLAKNSIDAADILSFLDLSNRLDELREITKPTVMAQLARSFHINNENLLLSEKEVEKIYEILSGTKLPNPATLVQSSVAKKLTSNQSLCAYFRAKTTNIPQIARGARLEFDFAGTKHQELESDSEEEKMEKAEKRTELNQLFNRSLTEEASAEDVARFFSDCFALDIKDVQGNEEKLREFVASNINGLAFVLAVNPQKEAEFSTQNFITLLSKILIDGCSKNIGSQFSMTLHTMMLKDVCDVALYRVLADIIVPQIINNPFAGDVIGTENDPLCNAEITSYYLAPEALLLEVAKVFYRDGKKGEIDSWQVIGEKLGSETREKLLELFSAENEQNKDKIEEQAAKMAAQITLIATIGEEEAQKNQFHSHYLQVLQRAESRREASASPLTLQ